jgi:ParB family transcriptional regulator, chromosome partitioning protein
MSRKLARRSDLTTPATIAQSSVTNSKLFDVSDDFPSVVEIDIDRIDRETHQPRSPQDDTSLAELRQSIERHGLLYPILVIPKDGDAYALVGGGRRLRVFELLGRTTIFARVLSGDPDELALVDNLQRKSLNAVETARSLNGLRNKHDYTQEKLAEVIGKTPATVSRVLGILTLPQEVLDEYLALVERIPQTTLEEVAAAPSEESQRKLWSLAKKGVTAKAIVERRQEFKGDGLDGLLLKKRAAGAAVRSMVQTIIKLEENQEGIGDAERAALRALQEKIAMLLDG